MNGLPEALAVIAELHDALGRPPLDGAIGVYEFGDWRVRLNGDGEEQDGIPPFTASIEFNGWPAGLVDPAGGVIAAGELANEDTFIEAARAEIARVMETP